METYFLHLLSVYKYPILIPASLVEGHIVSLICGFLAKLGLINPILAGLCIAFGNLIGDIILYWLGFYRGHKVLRFGTKWFRIEEQSIRKAKEIFHKKPHLILLTSKLTNGFGIAMAILFTAGLLRIRFGLFLVYNFIGECVWTASLITLGYLLGNAYTKVDNIIMKIGVVTASIIALYLIFRFIQNTCAKKLSK